MGEPPADADWGRVIDVCGVTHAFWRACYRGPWFRLCLDIGPDIYTQPVDLSLDTLVTCLWCVARAP